MARVRGGWGVGVVLVGALVCACGGGSGADDTANGDPGPASVEVFDTAPDTPGTEAVAEQVVPLAWMPAEPVDADTVFPELTSSEGLAVDGQGRFLLTANDALMRLAPGGSPEILAPIPKAPGQPTVGFAGVAWHPAWGAVIAQTSGDRLYRWTEEGGLVLIGDPIGKGPNGVLFDGQGRLIVSLSKDAETSVIRLDAPGAVPVLLAPGIPFANGLALSADGGTLYVASTSQGAVYQVPLAGAPPYSATVLSNDGLLAGADGLLLSPDGWVVVASWTKGRIVAVNPPTGELRVVSDAPAASLKHVASLAFGPGGDLDARCLFATRLGETGLARVCP